VGGREGGGDEGEREDGGRGEVRWGEGGGGWIYVIGSGEEGEGVG